MAKYKTLDSYVVGNQNSDQDFMNMLTDIQDSNNVASQAAADRANEFTSQSQETAMRFNAEEADKNRAFQASLSNTAHQREVRDLVRAGLNPVLSANNGAAVTSGAAGSVSGAQGIKAEMDMQKAQLFAQYYMNKANNANAVKMNNDQIANALKMKTLDNATALRQSQIAAAASMYGANAAAAATRYAAAQSAAAMMYGADQTLTNSREQRYWDLIHPNTMWGTINSVINQLGSAFGFGDYDPNYGWNNSYTQHNTKNKNSKNKNG